MGRRPLPSRLKALRGNPGKRKNKREPQPQTAGVVAPAWLEAEAAFEWARLAPELERLGLLTVVDVAAFEGYCQSYQRWRDAERAVSEARSKGGIGLARAIQQGLEGMARARLRLVKSLAAEFGFTPASRSRVSAVPVEAADPFAEFTGLTMVKGGRGAVGGASDLSGGDE
jgi:P27 family predicted phage terminase small subunit